MMLAAAAAAGSASAQVPLSVEARGDVAAPTGDFADGAQIGVGYGFLAALGIGRGVGIYGGYGNTRFGLEESRANAIDAGFEAGVTAALPGAYSPWVGAGVVLHELELEDAGVSVEGEADPGFEVRAGVAVPIGRRARLTPGVGYRRYGTDILGASLDVSYLTFGLGLKLSF
jgi:hypothetical protein